MDGLWICCESDGILDLLTDQLQGVREGVEDDTEVFTPRIYWDGAAIY